MMGDHGTSTAAVVDGGRSRADALETAGRRFLAAYIDVFLIPRLLGRVVALAIGGLAHPEAVGALLFLPVLVAAEARRGTTPGKAVVRVEVRDTRDTQAGLDADLDADLEVGSAAVRWAAATRRRAWMAVFLVGLIPAVNEAVLGAITVAVLVPLLVSILRAPDGRGWHDRWAGTTVVTVPSRRRPAAGTIAAVVIAGLLLYGLAWWFDPDPPSRSTSFRALQDAQAVTCEVVHDGLFYPRRAEEVELQPGETFTGRFGPHDLVLSFTEAHDGPQDRRSRGLEIRQATRALFGTVGSGGGTDDVIEDVTTGPGLGEIVIRCEAW